MREKKKKRRKSQSGPGLGSEGHPGGGLGHFAGLWGAATRRTHRGDLGAEPGGARWVT